MLKIVCVRAGTKYGPEYVENLYDMMKRNLAEGTEGDFIVFTDQPDTYSEGITVAPLAADLAG